VCGEKGAARRGVLFRPNTGKLMAFSRVVAKQSYKGFPVAEVREWDLATSFLPNTGIISENKLRSEFGFSLVADLCTFRGTLMIRCKPCTYKKIPA